MSRLNFPQRVQQSFSRAVSRYDLLTQLHKEIGRELIKKIADRDCQRILDVGTGTGYLARKAKGFFPESLVVGLDSAVGMIEAARAHDPDIHWVNADAVALPFRPENFDAVISNLAYQWVENLPKAFTESYAVTKAGGVLAVTLFGFDTLKELFESLKLASAESPNDERLDLRRLATGDAVRAALTQAGYTDIELESEWIKVEFSDGWELLRWLKDIGADVLDREIFIGRDLLTRANAIYREAFPYHQGIQVTFEVIWIKANK